MSVSVSGQVGVAPSVLLLKLLTCCERRHQLRGGEQALTQLGFYLSGYHYGRDLLNVQYLINVNPISLSTNCSLSLNLGSETLWPSVRT